MANSSRLPAVRKPRPDFPLTPHNGTGYWCKKVRGKLHYFGKMTDDPNGTTALQLWLDQKDELLAGRKPRPKGGEGLNIYILTQKFLTHKSDLRASGEIGQRTLDEYVETGKLLDKHFSSRRRVDDLGPDDFQGLRAAMAKRWGLVRLGNEIQRVRSVFRYAYDARLIDRPVLFGPAFKKPSAKAVRIARASVGTRDLTAAKIIQLIDSASPNMRAMILLGINGGMGNADLGILTFDAIDFDAAWLDFPRQKTGVPRKVPLWPETIKAIRDSFAVRRQPKDKNNTALVFVSPQGKSYSRETFSKDENRNARGARAYGLSHEFAVAMKAAGITGHGFYDLRRTFQTIAEGCNDLVAVQAIMGHAPQSNDMSSVYRQRVDESRLLAAVNHVRSWLYSQTATEGGKNTLKSAG